MPESLDFIEEVLDVILDVTQVKLYLGSAWYFIEEVLDVILDVVLSMAST